jgi:hypothetical protein
MVYVSLLDAVKENWKGFEVADFKLTDRYQNK